MSKLSAGLLILLAGLLSSCAGQSPAATATEVPVEEPVATATEVVTITPFIPPATATPEFTATPEASPTWTPAPPFVRGMEDSARCFFGPSKDTWVETHLDPDQYVAVLGRDVMGVWFQIENPNRAGMFCWVSASETALDGDVMLAPVVGAPANFASQVQVVLDPAQASVDCTAFPFNIEVRYTVVVTGPVTVKIRRMRSDGVEKAGEFFEFKDATPRNFTDNYAVNAAGTYWYRVLVTSPNAIQAEAAAEIVCQ